MNGVVATPASVEVIGNGVIFEGGKMYVNWQLIGSDKVLYHFVVYIILSLFFCLDIIFDEC